MTVHQGTLKLLDAAGHQSNAANFPFDFLPVSSARFPGDPGSGVIMSGSTMLTDSGSIPDGSLWLDDHTTGTKKHKLIRLYGYPGSNPGSNQMLNRAKMADVVTRGGIPVMSTKYLNRIVSGNVVAVSLDDILNGVIDAVIDADADACKALAPAPIYNSFGHEMFDDYNTIAGIAKVRQVYRYIRNRYWLKGVTNVAWYGPTGMCDWEYRAANGGRVGPSFHQDPDWKGTFSGPGGTVVAADWYTGPFTGLTGGSCLDMFSFDQYSPLPPGPGPYKSFGAQLDVMNGRLVEWQRPKLPWLIPEIGCPDSTTTVNWVTHWEGNADSVLERCIAHDIIGYCYFNYGPNSSLYSSDQDGLKLAGYDPFFQDARVLGI
jgi:hypothetical protein